MRLTLLSALAPQPDSQGRQHDEGQDADPERDADITRSHLHPEEDSEQLCEGNQPEEDRDDKRCGSVAHPNSLSRLLESRWGGESTAAFGDSRCSATISSLVLAVGLIL